MDNKGSSKSITCCNIPEKFLDKAVAKNHFGKFGTIKNFSLRPKNYSCSVEFENFEAAELARENGNVYKGYVFDIEFTEEPKGSAFNIDPDVQIELHAMMGKSTFLEPLSQTTYIKKSPKSLKADFVNTEIEQLLLKQTFSIEDRYRILDAKDKLLRQYVDKGNRLIGSCPDMCPEKERLMREFQMQVASFEMSPGTNQMDHRLAVKQYSRSSADQETPLPHELRPESVLRMSMNYLLAHIVDLSEDHKTNISDWFHFVWDRMRSIRKDITQQDLCTLETVTLVEQCARFHIHCSARLVAEDPSVFDQKINTENLTKCLQTLKYMYRDLRLQNIVCPNEPEFRAYVVLLNLNDGNFLWEFQQFSDDIIKSQALKYAFLVYQAIENNNYVRFFQLVAETTYLNACILLRYFNQIRLKTLVTLLKAYSPKNPSKFSFKEFKRVLALEDFESASNFLEYHGLTCDSDAIYLDKRNFYYPDFPFSQERSHVLVESKRRTTVGEVINGRPFSASQISYLEKHELQNSFDENGYLKEEVFESYRLLTKERESESVFKIPKTRTVSPRQKKTTETIMPKFEFSDPVTSLDIYQEANLGSNSSFLQLTPPRSSESQNRQFNFMQEFETQQTDEYDSENVIHSEPEEIQPFVMMDKENSPEPLEAELEIYSPFTPTSSSQSLSPIDKKVEVIDIETKLNLIENSATSFLNLLEDEVVNETIISCANEVSAKYKQLFEDNPKQLLSIILNEVVTDALVTIAENELLVEQILEARKLRNVYKVLRHWTFMTKRNAYRKQQLISAPIYMDHNVLSVTAEEFRLPSIRNSNDMAEICRSQPDLNINLKNNMSLKYDSKIDLIKIVSNEINVNHTNNANCYYWKTVISFPDKDEDDSSKFSILIDKWLKSAFTMEQSEDSSILTTKQYVSKLKRDLAVCLQSIKSSNLESDKNRNKVKSSNGMIFIVNHQRVKLAKTRWNQMVSQLSNIVPIAIIVCNSNHETMDTVSTELNLNHVNIKKIKILLHSRKEMNLKSCVKHGLQFIAKNSEIAVVPLELELTETCLSKTLGEEFWRRIVSTINENEVLSTACSQHCSFVINVFNEAVDKLTNLLGKSFEDIGCFPPEFKRYLHPLFRKYPLSFEQFPDNWNEARKIPQLKAFLTLLHLPPFTETPSKDCDALKDQIAKYMRSVLGDINSRLIALAQLYVIHLPNSEIQVSWVQIIRLIVTELIEENLQKLKILQSVPFVVYNSNEIFQYMNEPWWLKMDLSTQRKSSLLTNSFDQSQSSKKRKTTIEFSSDEISKILKTGEATLKKLEKRSIQKDDNNLSKKYDMISALQETENYFENNKIVWKECEKKLFG